MNRRQLLKIAGGGSKIIAQGLITNVYFDTTPTFNTTKLSGSPFVINAEGEGEGPYTITFGNVDADGNVQKTGIPTVTYNLDDICTNGSVISMSIDSKYLNSNYFGEKSSDSTRYLDITKYLSEVGAAEIELTDDILIWSYYENATSDDIIYGPSGDYVRVMCCVQNCMGIVNCYGKGFKPSYIYYVDSNINDDFASLFDEKNRYTSCLIGYDYTDGKYQTLTALYGDGELYGVLNSTQETSKVISIEDSPCVILNNPTGYIAAPFDICTPTPGGNTFEDRGFDYIPLLYGNIYSTNDNVPASDSNFGNSEHYYINTGSSFFIDEANATVAFNTDESVYGDDKFDVAFLGFEGALYNAGATHDVSIVFKWEDLQGGTTGNFCVHTTPVTTSFTETPYSELDNSTFGTENLTAVRLLSSKNNLVNSDGYYSIYNALIDAGQELKLSVYFIWSNVSTDMWLDGNLTTTDFIGGAYEINRIVRIDCTDFQPYENADGETWYVPHKSKVFFTQPYGLTFMDE